MERVGLYDEDMSALEDWEYWFRIALHGYSFNYLPDDRALALVRVHRSSLSWNWNNMTANRSKLKNNIKLYLYKTLDDDAERNKLLELNEHSAIIYLGFATFMNIKYYDFWWGIKKAFAWSHKYGYYKYFALNSIHSLKVRLKNAL